MKIPCAQNKAKGGALNTKKSSCRHLSNHYRFFHAVTRGGCGAGRLAVANSGCGLGAQTKEEELHPDEATGRLAQRGKYYWMQH